MPYTKEDILAMDDVARHQAFRSMSHSERQSIALGFCGNRNAEFPQVLWRSIEVDQHGYVHFNYVRAAVVHSCALDRINAALEDARQYPRARERDVAVKRISDDVAALVEKKRLVDLWWEAHMDAINAGRSFEVRT